ncbi:hypothetical protein NC99_30460 [Sunxiuqinia dokdonensis]|uniref:Uncharacterized protein n=1 Tax=Sunxiuqinia dokdonensis TaxID=1409788 RepID=A0A0L8V6R1_9BACT|nr:hypothetical protein NC99_30460 [Sunxiuqinia dokdonensis]
MSMNMGDLATNRTILELKYFATAYLMEESGPPIAPYWN